MLMRASKAAGAPPTGVRSSVSEEYYMSVVNRGRRVRAIITTATLLLTGGIVSSAVNRPAAAAEPPPDLLIQKVPVSSPVAGGFRNVIGWTISWTCASITTPCNNTTVTDTLPAPLQLKSATTTGGLVTAADVVGNSVTWHLESTGTPGVLDAGSVGTLTISALAPCSTTGNQTFNNVAKMGASNATTGSSNASGNPSSSITVTQATSCDPPPPPPPSKGTSARLNAANADGTGGRMPFWLTLPYAPAQYDLVDPTPANVDVTSVGVGAPATVRVSCDNGATYETVDFYAAGPFGSCVKTGAAWNVTHTKFTVPAQTDTGWADLQNAVYPVINTLVKPGTPVGTVITNTTQAAGTAVPTPLTASGTVVAPGPFPTTYKSRYVTPGEAIPDWFGDATHPVIDGDIGYQITLGNNGNNGSASAPLIDPVVTDLLDPNVTFVPGESWWRTAYIDNESKLVGTGCNTPNFEVLPNFGTTGKTLLRWTFSNCTFPAVADSDPVIHLFVNLRATAGLPANTSVSNSANIQGNNALEGATAQPGTCDVGQSPDVNDLDGDGNTTESICSENNTDTWIVPKLATIDATKWVNGAADPIGTWTRYPVVGNTAVAADGYATYHLFLEMKGNVVSDKLELVDVLPHIGDTATLNKNAVRKSDWSMELVGPLQIDTIDRTLADPAQSPKNQPLALWQPVTSGVTVSYSASDNPCRLTADSFGKLHVDNALTSPTGCTPSPWTQADATNPDGARSFAVVLDANQEGYLPATKHGDLIRITVKVKDINDNATPDAGTVGNDKVAWNSFGYTVTDTDAFEFLSAEPIKVGVKMTTLPATTASIGNYVWWDEDNNGVQNPLEEGINGVTVTLYDGAGNVVQTTVTVVDPADPSKNGYYRFYGLDPNTPYSLKFGAPSGYVLTGTNTGADDAVDNDASLVGGAPTIASAPTAGAGSYTDTYDVGFYKAPLYSLGNRVWFDINNSGKIDAADGTAPGAANVVMNLLTSAGAPVLNAGVPVTTTTDANGYYRFDNLVGADYIVEVAASNFGPGEPLQGRLSSTGPAQNANPNSDLESDDNGLDATVSGAIRSGVVTVGPNYAVEPASETDLAPTDQGAVDKRANMTVDFGVITPLYAVGNYVWFDTNRDGLQTGESPAVPMTVALFRADGTPVATTTTDGSGKYIFDNLLGGDYYVEFTPPANYRLTVTTGADATLNSNPDPVTRRTPTFTLDQSLPLVVAADGVTASRIDRTIDAGLVPAYTLGNLVWEDFNNNGIADDNEAPIAGVTVDLYLDANSDGVPDTSTPLATAATGSNGKYLFSNLDAGKYIVQIAAGQPVLAGLKTSGTPTAAANNDTDNDNNGVPVLAAGAVTLWRSGTVTLGPIGTEPANEVGGLEAGNPDEDADVARDDMGNWSVDFGFYRGVRIGNQLWLDGLVGQPGYDDGIFAADGSEPGLNNISVELWLDNGDGIFDPAVDTKVDTTATDGEGNFWFEHRTPGEKLFVAVKAVNGGKSSTPTAADPNAADNNDDGGPVGAYASVSSLVTVPAYGASPTGEADAFPVENAETEANTLTHVYPDGNSDLRIDLSFIDVPIYSIGNEVWFDVNNDGVKQAAETYVPNGVKMNLLDASGAFIKSTTTTAGLYLFDKLNEGSYIVEIDKSNFAAGGLLEHWVSSTGQTTADTDQADHGAADASGSIRSGVVVLTLGGEPTTENPSNDSVTPNLNSNLTVDLGLTRLALGNRVWLDTVVQDGVQGPGELGVSGVTVELWTSDGTVATGTMPLATTVTGAGGFYLFDGLSAGSYVVRIPTSEFGTGKPLGGYISTEGNGTVAPSPDTVSSDLDDNGTQNETTGWVETKPVTLTAANEPTAEADLAAGYSQGGLDANINLTVDLGFVTVPPLSLGNRVWLDANNSGAMDGTEAGISGVTVELYLDANGDGVADSATPVANTTTDTTGFYLFTGLAAGTYVVMVPKANFAGTGPLAHLRSSDGSTAANDNIDIDDSGLQPGNASEDVWSKSVTLSYYDEPKAEAQVGSQTNTASDDNSNLTVDFGFFQLGSIAEGAWFDVNRDGVQDPTEAPIPGVLVKLMDSTGTVVATTTTAADGSYHFDDLIPGSYSVMFDVATLPAGYVPTLQKNGPGTTDSDADRVTGMSSPVSVVAGSRVTHIALGAYVSQTDLTITKVATNTSAVTVGQQRTWKLVMTNNGPDPAAGPQTVTDVLPAGLTFVSTSGDLDCTTSGQTVTCKHASILAVGSSATVEVVTKIGAGTTPIINTATVVGSGTETVASNNTASASLNRSGKLPITGSDIGRMLAAAMTLVGLGLVLVSSRRRTTNG
jgi:uncharacterized repeat protein (TIGR01451 family)